MAHNDQAGGSRTGGDNAYLSMLAQYKHADNEEIEHAADDEMEAPSASEAERGDAGTTTSGAEEGGPSGSEARKDRKRKKREPNKLGTTQHAFTEVDPKSGLPTKPEKYAKGYGIQLGCIARDWGGINDDNLKAKDNEGLAAYLIDTVHTRYKFPAPYNNKDIKTNIVNTQALGKLGKAFSTWRSDVRKMIEEEGAGFDEIHKMWPSISEEDFKEFSAIEATAAKKNLRQWGKEMQKKNVAPHNLESRGYAGKEPIWQKEDARREGPSPYD